MKVFYTCFVKNVLKYDMDMAVLPCIIANKFIAAERRVIYEAKSN